jgi:hypothetical protein
VNAERWDRLAATLAAAGIDATVHARSYPGGTSRSITIKLPGGLLEVHDKWWRKNADVWIGWQVHTENADGIVTREWPLTKKRSEVAAAVAEALR